MYTKELASRSTDAAYLKTCTAPAGGARTSFGLERICLRAQNKDPEVSDPALAGTVEWAESAARPGRWDQFVLQQVYVTPDVVLVLLDTSNPDGYRSIQNPEGWLGKAGHIGAGQLQALDHWLDDLDKGTRTVFLAGHHPLSGIDNRADVMRVISRHKKVSGFLSAHTHAPSSYRLEKVHQDGREFWSINVASITDWPMQYMQLDFGYGGLDLDYALTSAPREVLTMSATQAACRGLLSYRGTKQYLSALARSAQDIKGQFPGVSKGCADGPKACVWEAAITGSAGPGFDALALQKGRLASACENKPFSFIPAADPIVGFAPLGVTGAWQFASLRTAAGALPVGGLRPSSRGGLRQQQQPQDGRGQRDQQHETAAQQPTQAQQEQQQQ